MRTKEYFKHYADFFIKEERESKKEEREKTKKEEKRSGR